MRNAVDFSWARPTEFGDLDALFYVGNALPDKAYVDGLRAKGVGVCLIYETDPNRSQLGNLAGHADAVYADRRADSVGYPESCSIAYVVSDGSRTTPNTGAEQIAAYAAGIAEASRRPIFFYGNEYACNAAMSGAPHALGTWIPSTWGNGTLLTQEANIASPIDGTDLNTVHAPYGNWTTTPEVPDLTDEQAAMLEEVHGILTGGSKYPSLEQRIEAHVDATIAARGYVLSGKVAKVSGKLTGTAS